MQFDIFEFGKTSLTPYESSFSVDLSGFDFPGFTVPAPVQAVFQISFDDTWFHVALKGSGMVCGECGRCLAPASQTVEFASHFDVKPDEIRAGETDMPVTQKGLLDLTEFCYRELLLEAPSVLLCTPDCPGLCMTCGQKIGAGCTCQPTQERQGGDARLSILKSLLN